MFDMRVKSRKCFFSQLTLKWAGAGKKKNPEWKENPYLHLSSLTSPSCVRAHERLCNGYRRRATTHIITHRIGAISWQDYSSSWIKGMNSAIRRIIFMNGHWDCEMDFSFNLIKSPSAIRALLLQALSKNTQHDTVTLCVANKAEKKDIFHNLRLLAPLINQLSS